jgi:16S rRNA (guanine966-N2)-methyltransferase
MQSNPTHLANLIRIIGGKYKGRKISILPNSNIRPTPDRVRETLFNWLMHDINNLRCLDLFAGSGALSLESLSRNAGFVCSNDSNPKIIHHLVQIFKILNIQDTSFRLINHDALWLLQNKPIDLKLPSFDLIFLDPPFNQGYFTKALDLILTNNWLNPPIADYTPLIYFEVEYNLNINDIIQAINLKFVTTSLKILKIKTTGMICYGLIKVL